jgi:isoleucyl-tRNA synthetase
LEAAVELRADTETYDFLQSYRQDLTTLFIVSQVTLIASGEMKAPLSIAGTKSSFGKCERCWNYREAVGKDSTHPTLCDRCVEAVR